MITLLMLPAATVAGARAGAGADEVVCVLETGDRDLSRNSAMDCASMSVSRTGASAHYSLLTP